MLKATVIGTWLNAGIKLALVVAVATTLSGCGGGGPEKALIDPAGLIDKYEMVPLRHHPDKLTELSVGEFDITLPISDDFEVYHVRFEAFAVVPVEKVDKLKGDIASKDKTLRDRINSVVLGLDSRHVTDTELTWMKSELRPILNRVLQTDEVRDIVFGNFSVERY